MSSPIIKVSNLSKSFKQYKKEPGLVGSLKSLFYREYLEIQAVESVNFNIERGEFVGFIGSNGAGKTTTLKCLSGLLYPSSGMIEVMGENPWNRKKSFLKKISLVMGQKNQLWWDLPAIDSFLLNKSIYEISDADFKKKLNELVDLLELEEVINIQVRKLSLGQRMKCELLSALLHSPEVLFLDEPTIGLDVVMQQKLRNFFREYNEDYKTTVILTSHYMEDVKELCKRVIVIDSGKIVYDGLLKDLIAKYATHKNISFVTNKKIVKSDIEGFGDLIDSAGTNATISVKREDVPQVSAAILKRLPVEDLDIKEIELDEVVR
ncbi:ATP-binding cassette domain-containing protein, partial [Candidatus Dojkabacteria bacterium]|nr:ATP-binding cassette domain-containing protein [Candidatus Dojkabacteria bacterium]